ncbi:hypothetical protein QT972_26335 [Microcoleus sp. herbarium7]|uniref:hypothetical protein n=1 Tax=Microcoleus sp. herbarium7 TaxID=3055435 RepID=UPI002FD1CA7B
MTGGRMGWLACEVSLVRITDRTGDRRHGRSPPKKTPNFNQAEAAPLYVLVNSMTAAIRSPDSPRSRSTRKPAPGPAQSKVTSIARARRAKNGPELPKYSAADEQAGAGAERSVLKVMPDRQRHPVWLRSLLRVERASCAAAVLLLGGALTLYGLTVYSEQRWSQEYQKLETLRLREQQLSAASEVLKHQLAKEAQNPETGLAPQKPADTIFLAPAPERRVPAAAVPNSSPAIENRDGVEAPLGY